MSEYVVVLLKNRVLLSHSEQKPTIYIYLWSHKYLPLSLASLIQALPLFTWSSLVTLLSCPALNMGGTHPQWTLHLIPACSYLFYPHGSLPSLLRVFAQIFPLQWDFPWLSCLKWQALYSSWLFPSLLAYTTVKNNINHMSCNFLSVGDRVFWLVYAWCHDTITKNILFHFHSHFYSQKCPGLINLFIRTNIFVCLVHGSIAMAPKW